MATAPIAGPSSVGQHCRSPPGSGDVSGNGTFTDGETEATEVDSHLGSCSTRPGEEQASDDVYSGSDAEGVTANETSDDGDDAESESSEAFGSWAAGVGSGEHGSGRGGVVGNAAVAVTTTEVVLGRGGEGLLRVLNHFNSQSGEEMLQLVKVGE